MKFFKCQNEECDAHIPRPAKVNNVKAAITFLFPMLEDGEIDYDGDPKLHDIEYICDLCGDSVEELSGSDLMRCRITEAVGGVVLGKFQSYGRGNVTFNFACDLKTKKVKVREGISLWEYEYLHIWEMCKDAYESHAIKVQILDCDPNTRPKTYILQLENIDENIIIEVVATSKEVLKTDNRPLNTLEVKKVFKTIRDSPY